MRPARRVNIVSPWSLQYDHILRRMTEKLPWPVTDRAQPGAFNYFFPYQFYTPTFPEPCAALFSHDMGHRRWPVAAREVNLRIAWTPLYTEPLSAHGPTRRILPGISHDEFTPGKPVTEPIVGVVGIVYGDGRKGEDLWAQLVADKDGLELRAAGQNWAGGATHIPYCDMPDFLRGLQVFLCTSRVEGVPYPPLEALSCGVKVVIPRGVGLLDELPDIPGICRFACGDYADMRRAIDEALATEADPEALRASVAGYTWDAWVQGHLEAFEEWL